MVKKVRLIDDEVTAVSEDKPVASTSEIPFTNEEKEQLMKYAEAIDWKLWEILKILRSQVEEK